MHNFPPQSRFNDVKEQSNNAQRHTNYSNFDLKAIAPTTPRHLFLRGASKEQLNPAQCYIIRPNVIFYSILPGFAREVKRILQISRVGLAAYLSCICPTSSETNQVFALLSFLASLVTPCCNMFDVRVYVPFEIVLNP